MVNIVCVCAYVPHIKLSEAEKMSFWEALENILRSILEDQYMVLGGDFSSHIGIA